ncbi:hypothetical protein RSSM_00996 [Rhodopirellula sallentina SM41]|uniref:Uncharacterized protein n=1 Tax=Rhodopirellula sallentina SM41 TaxID=1263870 RepID=M5U8F3_9BACT|nr:hypothetical protein RSSM_00996 [Rhodopirellula sallentina SM41]
MQQDLQQDPLPETTTDKTKASGKIMCPIPVGDFASNQARDVRRHRPQHS